MPSEMPECSGTERGSYLFGMPGRNLSGRQILSLLRQVEKKVAEFGEGRVRDLIEECMSNNWKGIIWDKMTQIPQRSAGDRIQNRVSEVDNW